MASPVPAGEPVGDDRFVMRRVAVSQVEYDESIGGERPVSSQMSVGVAPGYASCRLVGEADPAEVWNEGGEEYLMVVSVRLLREFGLDVRRSEGGPGHCDIVGARGLRRSALRRLFRQVCWVSGYAPKHVSPDKVLEVVPPHETASQ